MIRALAIRHRHRTHVAAANSRAAIDTSPSTLARRGSRLGSSLTTVELAAGPPMVAMTFLYWSVV
jgi:hypothetical protein